MSVSQAVASHLPALRRFSRALSGSQKAGDSYVVAVLEALAADPARLPAGLDPKIALFRMLSRVWGSVEAGVSPRSNAYFGDGENGLDALPPRPRQAFFLLAVEGFDPESIAAIMDTDVAEVARLVSAADEEIASRVNGAKILIIEDEVLTASYLEEISGTLGHRVTGVARTKDEALKLAMIETPDLVLSDIQLADGSSGISAVNEILSSFEVPVIFITGHPEMLLTGTKPEPAFLIAKPFNADVVKAVIGQALFFEVHSHSNLPRHQGTDHTLSQ